MSSNLEPFLWFLLDTGKVAPKTHQPSTLPGRGGLFGGRGARRQGPTDLFHERQAQPRRSAFPAPAAGGRCAACARRPADAPPRGARRPFCARRGGPQSGRARPRRFGRGGGVNAQSKRGSFSTRAVRCFSPLRRAVLLWLGTLRRALPLLCARFLVASEDRNKITGEAPVSDYGSVLVGPFEKYEPFEIFLFCTCQPCDRAEGPRNFKNNCNKKKITN